MNPFNNELAKYFLVPAGYYTVFTVLVLILLLVILLLKGLALWRSARKGQSVWFWIFIFVNTLGILEIIYLLTNNDEFVKIEKKPARNASHSDAGGEKKSRFKLSFKGKTKEKKVEPIDLIDPELAALNDFEIK
ncbi:MAG: DUF5652 family protein [Patescibacteria group bacterium]|nr:DUF5652 family protein [Patescibacteria group bacterium]